MEFKTQGNKLFSQEKIQEAIEAYSAGIELVVENNNEAATEEDKSCIHLLYSNRSMLHLKQVMVDEALQDAELAIEAKPEYAKAYLRRASVLVELFKNKEALQDVCKAAELSGGAVDQELRDRALGKTWVANGFVRQRKELQKKFKGCNYLIIGTDMNGEPFQEPMTHSSNPDVLIDLLQTVDRTGHANFGHLLHLIENSMVAKTEEQLHLRKVIKAQLQREYGATEFSDPTPPMSDLYSSVDRCKLFLGVILAATRGAFGDGRVFYPGAPKWIDEAATKKGGKLGDFEELVAWEMKHRPRQQDIDRDVKNFSTCAQQLREYRKRFDGREHKCTACNKAVSDPDPQECLCGEIFCSFDCHMQNYPKHKDACTKAQAQISEPIKWTVWYWELVLMGYYPCKDEVDVVALWKERNIPEPDSYEEAQRHPAIPFHYENEGKKIDSEGLAQGRSETDRLRFFSEAEHSGRFYTRYMTPLRDDTRSRLTVKSSWYKNGVEGAEKHFKYLFKQEVPCRFIPADDVQKEISAFPDRRDQIQNGRPGNLAPFHLNCYQWGMSIVHGAVQFQ